MTTTPTLEAFSDYADVLDNLRALAGAAAGVEGADSIGALLPIRKYGTARQMGEFSSLSEWLDDVADTLADFLKEDGDEIEGWTV